MKKLVVCLAVVASGALGQYKMEPAAAPPVFAAELEQQGARILDSSGKPWAEIWLRKQIPSGPKSMEEPVAFPTIPHGTLIGVIRYEGTGADRRGQQLKPGVYTLRYSLYPIDGSHQGIAPQRDFLVLTPVVEDKDPASQPAYDPLMDMGRKASGTPHPAVLELGAAPADAKFPSLEQLGEDWVYNVKAGGLPMAIVVMGVSAG